MAHKLSDARISAVPPFPGLRCFADGHDFKQWTGDDSKALTKVRAQCLSYWIRLILSLKVFLSTIAGYVPSVMVLCVAAFMDACYIARQNAINSPSLEHFRDCIKTFHQLRTIFIETGVCWALSLPRQHALKHFYHAIHLFGFPNGLCSSITESKHIQAVKQPWQQSSRYHALTQMLGTLHRMDKMSALHWHFEGRVMLQRVGLSSKLGDTTNALTNGATNMPVDHLEDLEDEDEAVVSGKSQDSSEFDVQLATKFRACAHF